LTIIHLSQYSEQVIETNHTSFELNEY